MSTPPLTHHDIIKRAAPLTKSGLKVKLAACDRADRYIEFEAQQGYDHSFMVVHALEVKENGNQRLSRILIHDSGLVSTLVCTVDDLQAAIDTLKQTPLTRQLLIRSNYVIAYSYTLTPDHRNHQAAAFLQMEFACAQVAGVQLRIDISTGDGMPADVRLLATGAASSYLRDTLANGTDLPLDHRAASIHRLAALATSGNTLLPKLPDDILAILGPQWRPLRFQGDHWKGVLRQLGSCEKRTARAEKYINHAVDHLHTTLVAPPTLYQQAHAKARWRVYVRRLQPVMVLLGILAMMPISWLFVSSGTMTIHPLALGLTPLLMVGVVALTAREIPVMEIPPIPSALSADAWT